MSSESSGAVGLASSSSSSSPSMEPLAPPLLLRASSPLLFQAADAAAAERKGDPVDNGAVLELLFGQPPCELSLLFSVLDWLSGGDLAAFSFLMLLRMYGEAQESMRQRLLMVIGRDYLSSAGVFFLRLPNPEQSLLLIHTFFAGDCSGEWPSFDSLARPCLARLRASASLASWPPLPVAPALAGSLSVSLSPLDPRPSLDLSSFVSLLPRDDDHRSSLLARLPSLIGRNRAAQVREDVGVDLGAPLASMSYRALELTLLPAESIRDALACMPAPPRRLDCSHNLIEQLQQGFFASTFYTHNLEILEINLSWNMMRSLPLDIGIFQNLLVLQLQHNHLAELCPLIGGCSLLLYLDISHNQLKSLPREMMHLRKLIFFSNHPYNSSITAKPPQTIL